MIKFKPYIKFKSKHLRIVMGVYFNFNVYEFSILFSPIAFEFLPKITICCKTKINDDKIPAIFTSCRWLCFAFSHSKIIPQTIRYSFNVEFLDGELILYSFDLITYVDNVTCDNNAELMVKNHFKTIDKQITNLLLINRELIEF